MTHKTMLLSLLLLAVVLILSPAAQAAEVTFEQHQIVLTVDPETHTASVTDLATVTIAPGWNSFFIRASANIESLHLAGEKIEYVMVTPGRLSRTSYLTSSSYSTT